MTQLMTADELASALVQFIGTESYTRLKYPWLQLPLLLTEGAKFLADQARCYWLMDAIASHQIHPQVANEPFQVWKLSVNEDHSAQLTCSDGDLLELARQTIHFTDFPLKDITLYAIVDEGLGGRVVLLTSEY